MGYPQQRKITHSDRSFHWYCITIGVGIQERQDTFIIIKYNDNYNILLCKSQGFWGLSAYVIWWIIDQFTIPNQVDKYNENLEFETIKSFKRE